MPRLWLLTDNFPFAQGETFVAAELPYLCAQGLEVHILPTARGALKQRRAACLLPHGVVVRRDIAQSLARARGQGAATHLRFLTRALTGPHWHLHQMGAEVRRALRKGPKVAGRNLWRLAKAAAHAAMLARVIEAAEDPPKAGDGLYAYWLSASALGMRWACPTLKLVSRAHGHDLFAERDVGHYLPLQPLVVSQLAALYCISDDAGRYARMRFPQHRQVVCVMPLGTPPTNHRARPSTDGRLRIITCARVSPVKDLDLLLAAVSRVRTPVLWTHIGEGPDRQRLMQACRHLPEHIRVHWTGALAHCAVLARLTREPADLFLNTSRYEGRPVSVMEALSVGLCVRAANVGGMRELLLDAWLFDRRAGAAGLAQCIDSFACMPIAARLAEAQHARDLWHRHANAEQNYPPFVRHLLQATQLCPTAVKTGLSKA